MDATETGHGIAKGDHTECPRAQPTATGPLSDLRVVELGQLIAGPFCGQLLGDLGAEVIKIEDPTTGDPMREWGNGGSNHSPLWWTVVGRNKKSVTCDLRDPVGQDIARRLIRTADIVVENFRPGTMEKWGLDYETLSAENPGLIMVRVTGFGQDGPYAGRAGYGSIGEAMGGLRYIVGDPATPPSRMGVSLGDGLAATFAALGALAALNDRHRTGRGQIVDSAIYEAVLAMTESLVTDYAATGYVRERTGAILPSVAPSNIYPTKDAMMALVAANQDTVFRRLVTAMGRPELAEDPRYATHTARGAHQVELDQLMAAWTEQHTWQELETICVDHGIPVGLMYRAPEMLADPHFAARQAIVRVRDHDLNELYMQNTFPRLSRTPGQVRWTGPPLGAHTDEILTDLGFDAEQTQALRRTGVIR